MARRRVNALRRRIAGELCLYCGLVATVEDHFPPYSYSHSGFLLPACRECNLLAGTAHPSLLPERMDYVKAKLKVRYAKYLEIPDWTEEELAKIDLDLRTEIRASLRLRRIVGYRIGWNGIPYLRGIDTHNWLLIPAE